MMVNSANPAAWPISGFTWILVYQQQTDPAKALALTRLLWWNLHDGQAYAEPSFTCLFPSMRSRRPRLFSRPSP